MIVDTDTGVPGGTGTFVSLSTPSLDAGDVAFWALDDNSGEGIYTDAGGTLRVVANESTPIPGGTGDFTQFGEPSIDGGSIVFGGVGSGTQRGIYLDSGGGLERVIDTSMTLEGKSILNLSTWHQGVSGNRIAFWAAFTDGSRGIYVAVPEPSTGLLLGLGLASLVALRCRTSQRR
jgi:hypothetical protein